MAQKIKFTIKPFISKKRTNFRFVQEKADQLGIHRNTRNTWSLKRGGKYYFTRNNSTLVAFTIGEKFNANSTGFKVIGAHTDSPCIRLAPKSRLESQNFNQTYVTTYGGGLWHTWTDRDLSLGGRVIYKDSEKELFKTALFTYEKPIFKVPNLAIHLRTDKAKWDENTETHLRPLFSTQVYEKLLKPEGEEKSAAKIYERHSPALVNLISKVLDIKPENLVDWDLYFHDTQPSQFIGINEDLISSPRIDNLFSSFHALKSLTSSDSWNKDSSFINMIYLFDHEECGSQSAQGAESYLSLQNFKRIFDILAKEQSDVSTDAFDKALQSSYIISADMAHGIHPNYSEKHHSNHQVRINQGVVIKLNHNQRYATDAASASILRIIADRVNVPIQDFIVKNDSPCGSTIGPIISARTGAKTIDIGAPQLGMHSIRETCGVLDGYYYSSLMTVI